MLKKLPVQPQLEMFRPVLSSFINPQHELCLLAKEIDWACLEKDFAPLYEELGRPSIPIRTIVGLLLLKQIYNLGDETVLERYFDSPYCQYFREEIYFQYKYPFDLSDFVHFRKRTRGAMQVKSWNRGTYITPKIRSLDDKKLPQWHCRRQDQQFTGNYSI